MGSVRRSPDDNRNDIAVRGTFYAPRFALTKREEHNRGYHSHIEMFKSGHYHRAGYIVTLENNILIATRHGRKKPLFNLEQRKNAVIRAIRPYIERIFRGISREEMYKISKKDAIPLLEL